MTRGGVSVVCGLIFFAMFGVLTSCARGGADAASFPSRNITMIIPFAVGGGTDVLGRALASGMERELGRRVIVVNRPGNNGIVGIEETLRARPDGYTLVILTNNDQGILLETEPDLSFSFDDFRYVAGINTTAMVLVASRDSGIESMEDLRRMALENPGRITASVSAPNHLVQAIQLMQVMGINVTPVMRHSGNESALAIMGNHVDVAILAARFSNQIEYVGGRTLGVFSPERFPEVPHVPTMMEQGINLADEIIRLVAVHRDVPDEIVTILESTIKEVVNSELYINALIALNEIAKFTSSEEITASMRSYMEEVRVIVRENPEAFL